MGSDELKFTGELRVHYEGYGFVVSLAPGTPDVFVPARHIGEALNGDIVEVVARKNKKGLFDGEILQIVRRGLKQVVGRLERKGRNWLVVAGEERVQRQVVVDLPKDLSVQESDWVVVEIDEYPKGEKPMRGHVVRKLPPRGTLKAEIEFVIDTHQWPREFPKAVLEEAEKCQQRSQALLGNAVAKEPGTFADTLPRIDLRPIPFVTIDGADAKDFDDAVAAKPEGEGAIRCWVAIADVSAFVPPGSAIDREAYARATSVYFPGKVLPMLPEVLSNNLCSLRPNEDRWALVAEFLVHADGSVTGEKFYPALINSQARLTYHLVYRMLVAKEPILRDEYEVLLPSLESLSLVARWLKAARSRRGTIEFDLPEPEIILDLTGGIENIIRRGRDWSHQIIEEMMIAANEAVARFLTRKKLPCAYRVHEGPKPDKIRHFYQVAQVLGSKGPFLFPARGQNLNKIVQHFSGQPPERLMNTMLLRSMSQAIYSPENMGHFGLASDCYCHFTSPIRRYPDLIVHRILKNALRSTHLPLGQMTEHCSFQERKAMAAEREMLKLHAALFMQDKVGEAFEGIVSHITKFGLFIELKEYFVEGLLPMDRLTDDFYVFEEKQLKLIGKRRKKVFQIGTPMKLQLEEVNITARKINFCLLPATKK